MGKKLNNHNTSQKSYWKIKMQSSLNPSLVNNLIVLNVINRSVLPNYNYFTSEKIE